MLLAKEQILSQEVDSFKRIELMCGELETYLSSKYGRKVVGLFEGDNAELYYSSCNAEEQNCIYKSILNYYSLMTDAVAKDVVLIEPQQALKHALEWNGFATDDEIFKELTENSVIEMFDLDFRQIWRSNNFFKFSSHSLASLFCKPFPLNFKKEPANAEEKIAAAVGKLVSHEADYLKNIIGEHKIIELSSSESTVNKGELSYASTLIKNSQLSGFISVINVFDKAHPFVAV